MKRLSSEDFEETALTNVNREFIFFLIFKNFLFCYFADLVRLDAVPQYRLESTAVLRGLQSWVSIILI